jgi:hypothetical protein
MLIQQAVNIGIMNLPFLDKKIIYLIIWDGVDTYNKSFQSLEKFGPSLSNPKLRTRSKIIKLETMHIGPF